MNDKTVYSYINDIAQRLKEPRKYGDVSLMIGAGFSKNAQSKGMASRDASFPRSAAAWRSARKRHRPRDSDG